MCQSCNRHKSRFVYGKTGQFLQRRTFRLRDPSKMRLPPIPPPQEPPPYDLDPSNFPGQGGNEPVGGLLGMLLRGMMQQGQFQSGADSVPTPGSAVDAAPPREFPTTQQKPVRILSRRPAG